MKRAAYAIGCSLSYLEAALPFNLGVPFFFRINLGVPKTKEVAEYIIGK